MKLNSMEEIRHNLNRIVQISELENNWDGYGANRFSNEVIQKARDIIFILKYSPILNPTGRDSIQIEFEYNDNYLEFEIFKDRIEVYREKDLIPIKEEEIKMSKINEEVEFLDEFKEQCKDIIPYYKHFVGIELEKEANPPISTYNFNKLKNIFSFCGEGNGQYDAYNDYVDLVKRVKNMCDIILAVPLCDYSKIDAK